jgi:hypothetical protein
MEIFNSLLGEESHRSFAVKVLEGLNPFAQARFGDLSMAERNLFMFWLGQLIKTLEGLPAEYRASSGSDATLQKLVAARNFILKA